MNAVKSLEHIIYCKTRHRNEDGYLDQLYALQQHKSIPAYLITRHERLNYDRNCRYHGVQNVYNMPSFVLNRGSNK